MEMEFCWDVERMELQSMIESKLAESDFCHYHITIVWHNWEVDELGLPYYVGNLLIWDMWG